MAAVRMQGHIRRTISRALGCRLNLLKIGQDARLGVQELSCLINYGDSASPAGGLYVGSGLGQSGRTE